MRRAQIALEFSFMVMLAFVFFVVALLLLAFYLEKAAQERGVLSLQNEAASLQQELLLAAGVEDGYTRIVTVPDRLDGRDYTIAMAGTTITLTLDDGTTYNREVPIVVGNIMKGTNRIRKDAGAISIEQP